VGVGTVGQGGEDPRPLSLPSRDRPPKAGDRPGRRFLDRGGDFRVESRAIYGLTGVEGVARLLSFGYYLIAARVLSVSGFGVVRYTISLALLALAPLLVLATALNRELGAVRGSEARTSAVLGSSMVVALWLWLATTILCVVAGAAGLLGSASLPGLLIVVAGGAIFNLYYQISRGLGQIKRTAITYIGGSLLQLVALLAVVVAFDLTPFVGLLLFGLCWCLPVFGAEVVAPVARGHRLRIDRDVWPALWQIGGPLLVAQAGYMIWMSADQIWVDSALGSAQIGLYGTAKTLVQVFFVLTAGSMGVLLPRVAELRAQGLDDRARDFIRVTSLRLIAIAAVAAAVMIALRTPLLTMIFGDRYAGASGALLALTVGMAGYAAFVTITVAAIGWGRSSLMALGISVAAGSEVALLLLGSGSTIAFAGWANAISIGLGLVAVGLALARRPLR
jgi:O-antigen/teichoic acid export membrane protein